IKIAEEDQTVAAVVTPKFDTPQHPSKVTTTKVKSIAKEYGIPLDLHPKVPLEGRTMDQLPKDAIGLYEQFFESLEVRMKGWKDKFFFVDRRAILDTMAWRHHDSDVYDPLPDDDYSIVDVRALAENIIDLRPEVEVEDEKVLATKEKKKV
ncbi:hypothetical protein Tco_1058711, partial [Tanacetum coccineum]